MSGKSAIAAVRPGATGWAVPALPSAHVAAWLFARVVFPVVVAVAAIGVSAWMVLIAPISAMQAAGVVAIPFVLVRLGRLIGEGELPDLGPNGHPTARRYWDAGWAWLLAQRR